MTGLNNVVSNFKKNKTVPILFSNSTRSKLPEICLKEKKLQFHSNHKFLGILFDKKLTWNDHIQSIRNRCRKRINILKAVAGTSWGNKTKTLLMLYRSLIRSLLDYGCEAYDSASESAKQVLNSIQYASLRICAGALHGTSLAALQVELNEPPLELRRKLLTYKYHAHLSQIPAHPLKNKIQPCWQFEKLENKKVRQPFGMRIKYVKPTEDTVENLTLFPFPYWYTNTLSVSTELTDLLTKSDDPNVKRIKSLELINSKWNNSLHIYTDGSKTPTGLASASFYVPYFSIKQSKGLSNNTSNYRAELAAISIALEWIKQLNIHTDVVIFTDCLSALISLQSPNDNFATDILYNYTELLYKGTQVHMEWIPSHCGINGNEMADHLAKQALQDEITINNRLCLSEVSALLKLELYEEWKKRWSNYHSETIRLFKPTISYNFECALKRDSEVIIRRLRLNNIGLNADPAKIWSSQTSGNKNCKDCNTPETLIHYLTECPKYLIERAMLLTESNTVNPSDIIRLLKSTEKTAQKAIVSFVLRTKRFEEI